MIQTDNIRLGSICIHKVGNKLDDEGIHYSKSEIDLNLEIKDLLIAYFFSPFKNNELFNFSHDYNISMNEIYTYANSFFEEHSSLHEQSINIAKHLYNKSTHPQIKGGELYVTSFSNCIVDGKLTNGIGLFKSESKETYLRVHSRENNFEIDSDNGININKLDKGCLIFNIEKEHGYLVAIVDNVNKGSEAKYWKEEFLQLRARNDEYHYTQNVIALCKNFTSNSDFLNKAQKIDVLRKAIDYFKESDSFDMDDFSNQILDEKEVIEQFKAFRSNYELERDVLILDDFTISEQALKTQTRNIKNSIKLDHNFKISIDGDTRYLEKGYDENKGLNYYKLYYKNEE